MAKFAVIVLLALAAVASASPIGLGGLGLGRSVVSHNSHVSRSHIISPHLGGLGLGYGILGYPGAIVGHSISSHSSVGHVTPHLGLGTLGLRGKYFTSTLEIIVNSTC